MGLLRDGPIWVKSKQVLMLRREGRTSPVEFAGRLTRRMSGVFWMPCLLVCAAGPTLALPPSTAVERECMAASIRAHRAVCAVSDLDDDRQADYALTNDLAGSPARPAAILILLSGTREPYQLLLPQGLVASSFTFRDVNGDGKLDLALLGGLNETVGVFLNEGSGRFQFDRQERYLTAPSRDSSEMSLPPRAWLCDCVEPSSGSHHAVCSDPDVAHALPAASVRPAAGSLNSARSPHGVERSRAP